MKGDFSHRALDPHRNFAGVLQQQGRVLLDRDWNDQTSITRHWQDQAGRDVIGPEVAAVPSGGQDGFAITGAAVVGGQVELQVNPGRIWADGIVCYLPDPAPVTRRGGLFPTAHPGSGGRCEHDRRWRARRGHPGSFARGTERVSGA